jgi:eukaryotic-like serine/threonine-protein kinase
MHVPAIEAISPPETAEIPGALIGPYKLLEQIGEGGFGLVFMAEQQRPVRRIVALKVLKPGMDTRQVVARFEAERQALAIMDHPNIARVLDAGETESGRPYFVMELVKGVRITQYCDAHRLTLRERLALFATVCQAVQHAHQKGIIHRDLKPSNVLVAAYDDRPVVKVIDFGVAKALGQRLTEQTLVTGFGNIVGTLEYMSPEQAAFNALDVDTRSDIYSLGVLLYEILTGSTPLKAERLKRTAATEALRLIREEEAPRPSTRLSESKNLLVSVSALRKLEPARLTREVRGDLDWIVMKALEKDRNRRYVTPGSFARDIERYLQGEAIEARPPSWLYLLRKFGRKHRTAVLAAAVVVLALLAGSALATWQAIVATLAETKARQAGDVARAERQQAVTNLYHARVEEAAALRRARGPAYRTQVFNLLQEALRLDTPDKDRDRLRDEAVACLGDFVGLEPITLEDFPAGIQKIALTPDGEQVAVALDNGTIQLRRISAGGGVAQLNESAVDLGIDPANGWLVSAGAKGTIKVWQDYGKSGVLAAPTIEMHADLAGMSRNGRYAVGYSRRNDKEWLSVWDVARREIKAAFQLPSGVPERSFQVSDDGQCVAQAIRDGTKLYALVWKMPHAEPEKIPFAETNQETTALSISHDGGFLACSHGDDGIILLDMHEALPRPVIRCDEVAAASFSGDGRLLFFITFDGHIVLWNVPRHQAVAAVDQSWTRSQNDIYMTTISADGNTLATAVGHSHSVHIWSLTGSGEKLVLSGHEGGVPCLQFSPDGKMLASGSKDRWVKLWDTATGRLLRSLPRFDSSIQSIAFSSDGRLLATAQFGPAPQPVQVWDLATLRAFTPGDDELGQKAFGVAFSPDRKILAACGDGLTLWSVSEGGNGAEHGPGLSFERMIHLPGEASQYLCISPDGKLLAWADHRNSVCLWDLVNGREIPFIGPPLVYGWDNLAFFPDCDHLTFGTARMNETWDARSARRVSSFGQVGHVAASPDGRWLATTDLALWSARTQSRVLALPRENRPVWSLALTPDGERLAVGLADGEVAIWSVPAIRTELERIGLAWRADARPPEGQKPQPFVPATPFERKHQVNQYSNLAKRLARVGRFADAEVAYRAALKLMPEDSIAHGDFGKFLTEVGRYPEAEAELDEAIRLEPQHGWFRVQRGWVYADLGKWGRASAEFVQATQCKNSDKDAWYSQAILHLRDGNLDAYRKTCLDMLEHYGEGAAWTCTLGPGSGVDPVRIVTRAERTLVKSPGDQWGLNLRGAALYRAGRFEEAVKQFTEANERGVHPDPTSTLVSPYFLAMAHHRLGHAAEARRWLGDASRATEAVLKPFAKEPEKPTSGTIPPDGAQKLTLQLLRREADQLIRGPGSTVAR